MTKRWWDKKWNVYIENRGPCYAVFGPYRCKLAALFAAWILPGPTEFSRIERILEEVIVDPSRHITHPSGTVFEKRVVPPEALK